MSSASKPSAFVGTSFSTGSSSLSEFSPSVSLFNREFTISSSDLVSVTTTLLSTTTTSSNVTPISPSVLRMFTRHDKGSSSSSLPDSLSSIFVSSFLNPVFWKHRKMHNCDTCCQENCFYWDIKVFFLSNIIVLNLLLKQVYFGFPIFRPLAQLMRDYFSKCASCAPDAVS